MIKPLRSNACCSAAGHIADLVIYGGSLRGRRILWSIDNCSAMISCVHGYISKVVAGCRHQYALQRCSRHSIGEASLLISFLLLAYMRWMLAGAADSGAHRQLLSHVQLRSWLRQ